MLDSHRHPTEVGPTGPPIWSQSSPGKHFHATAGGPTSLSEGGKTHNHTNSRLTLGPPMEPPIDASAASLVKSLEPAKNEDSTPGVSMASVDWHRTFTTLNARLSNIAGVRRAKPADKEPLTKQEAKELYDMINHFHALIGDDIPTCAVCRDERVVAIGPGGYGRCPAKCRGEAT